MNFLTELELHDAHLLQLSVDNDNQTITMRLNIIDPNNPVEIECEDGFLPRYKIGVLEFNKIKSFFLNGEIKPNENMIVVFELSESISSFYLLTDAKIIIKAENISFRWEE